MWLLFVTSVEFAWIKSPRLRQSWVWCSLCFINKYWKMRLNSFSTMDSDFHWVQPSSASESTALILQVYFTRIPHELKLFFMLLRCTYRSQFTFFCLLWLNMVWVYAAGSWICNQTAHSFWEMDSPYLISRATRTELYVHIHDSHILYILNLCKSNM